MKELLLVLIDAGRATFSRPVRSLLTASGTLLGTGSLVCILGVSWSSELAIQQSLEELEVDRFTVVERLLEPDAQPQGLASAVEKLEDLNGVTAVGRTAPGVRGLQVRSRLAGAPGVPEWIAVDIRAANTSHFLVSDASIDVGRFFDEGHEIRNDAVAVVGRSAAERLGIVEPGARSWLDLGDARLEVIGIIGDSPGDPGLSGLAIVVSFRTADSLGVSLGQERLTVVTEPGVAGIVAVQAARAIDPVQPERLQVALDSEPTGVVDEIAANLQLTVVAIASIAMLTGAFGIASSSAVAVLERTGEVGLRRALGASPQSIAALFMVEAGMIGLLGGIVGTVAGLAVVAVVAAQSGWIPVVEVWLLAAAPSAALVVGALAGLIPAVRAARLLPVDALRSG